MESTHDQSIHGRRGRNSGRSSSRTTDYTRPDRSAYSVRARNRQASARIANCQTIGSTEPLPANRRLTLRRRPSFVLSKSIGAAHKARPRTSRASRPNCMSTKAKQIPLPPHPGYSIDYTKIRTIMMRTFVFVIPALRTRQRRA